MNDGECPKKKYEPQSVSIDDHMHGISRSFTRCTCDGEDALISTANRQTLWRPAGPGIECKSLLLACGLSCSSPHHLWD
jgi:hypothetical protein